MEKIYEIVLNGHDLHVAIISYVKGYYEEALKHNQKGGSFTIDYNRLTDPSVEWTAVVKFKETDDETDRPLKCC